MKALVLCGGLGERLRPYTESVPKVMLEVNGKPILQHVIEHLKASGLTDIVLLCGYKHEIIKKFFGDGKNFGVKLTYSVETEKLDSGGAVKNAEKFIDGDFLLVNGDNLTNFPIKELVAEFEKRKQNIMALVRPNNPYGVAKIKNIDGNVCEIVGFEEKPKMNEWINAGFIALKKETLKLFPEKGQAERLVYPLLQKRGELLGYLIPDNFFWKGIDTVKDLREANMLL
jgi:mannose-1-phosphate guanylyltransferase